MNRTLFPSGKKMEQKLLILLAVALVIYFLWMDVALYHYVQASTSKTNPQQLFLPFKGLSIKLMTMDHFNNYIFVPSCELFNDITQFSRVFYFISPNMISFIGVCFALASARCAMSDSFAMQRLAVFLFCVRNWMDGLDGLVARDRMGMTQHVSVKNTSGYFVDGFADSLGIAFFIVATYFYKRRLLENNNYCLNKSKSYLPLQLEEEECFKPSRRLLSYYGYFGLTLFLSSYFWNRYLSIYHQLLETPEITHKQEEMTKSSIFWVVTWFWRVTNPHALCNAYLIAFLVNYSLEFLMWYQYVGLFQVFALSLITEIHIQNVNQYLQS